MTLVDLIERQETVSAAKLIRYREGSISSVASINRRDYVVKNLWLCEGKGWSAKRVDCMARSTMLQTA